ncbi:hypothetical protein TRVL_01053 [Trypanosoma vivax]|nr:hypothetical protein TRVL_01053 [Trypanosoma vivax]
MAAAARDGEASGSRRAIASSDACEAPAKEMRSEAQTQGDGSGPLELTGCGGVDEERARKRPRLGRHTEGEEGRDHVCGRSGSACKQWYSLAWHTRTHHKHATTVKQKMKDSTVAVSPLLQRSFQCPYCPVKCSLKQRLTMHLQAKRGQPRREAKHNSLKVERKESAAHLVECPSLRELRKKHGLETLKDGEVVLQCSTGQLLEGTLQAGEPICP